MTELINLEMLKEKALKKYSLTDNDFKKLIKYLLDEKFIITDDDYKKIYDSKLYNRQFSYFYMASGQICDLKKYQDKTILILGLGGIGANVAEQLVRAGFQKFIFVDYDVVEKSNLIRQNAYYSDDVGVLKTDVLFQRVKSINDNIDVKTYNVQILSETDAKKYIFDSDFVICTLDKPYRKIRRIINDACVKLNKPVLFAGFSEFVGMVGPFVVPYKTACLKCIDKEMEEYPLQNVKITPSFGPLCSIISSIVTSEIINYFVNYTKNSLVGCTLMFNMLDYSTKKIQWERNFCCSKCGDDNDSK